MKTIHQRLLDIEANLSESGLKSLIDQASGTFLTEVECLKDENAKLRSIMMGLYKFIEENVGVRDVSLEKRLRAK